MPFNPPDSNEISIKIIEAVKQHPVLYISEVTGEAIRIQEFRQKVWKRISDELGLDSAWVKLRWKNLRDTYSRQLKVKGKSSAGSKKKKWLFEDDLSFLKVLYEPNSVDLHVELTEEYIKDINTGVIPSENLLEHLEEDEDDYSEYLEILGEDKSQMRSQEPETTENSDDNILQEVNGDQSLKESVIDTCTQKVESRYRKARLKQPKQEQIISNSSTPIIINASSILALPNTHETQDYSGTITTETVESCQNFASTRAQKRRKVEESPEGRTCFDYKGSTDEFFMSIAKTVQKLPPKAQADVKMDVCRIIHEAQQKHKLLKDSKNVQKYSRVPGVIPNLVLVPCRLIDRQNESC
ncbi:hypothetical protein QAD02_010970 [Eretmocerus hayati]|uniref:Uncharacterized protein n=1 Tax=Eretmocerus hayati TaxID=131215 RepID=A0ACC2NY09_9HYME|nr:hypothetical protein QAD02_010970 [Eretmocerus hayati]